MARANQETAADTTPADKGIDTDVNHPAVAGVAPPVSAGATAAGGDGDGRVPSVIHTATPGIAKAQANIEGERIDRDRESNARERALAGHRAPDTVDLPEAQLRVDDNRQALEGPGKVADSR